MALVSFPGTPSPYAPEPEDEEEDGTAKMSFLDHLEELRRRLIASVIAIAVGFAIAFTFIDHIFTFIMTPLTRVIPGGKFIYTQPAEAFMLYYVKGPALVGFILALPVVMWQAWKFIAPGLYANEKRFAIPFALFSTIFFICGAAFAHYMVFPWAWVFFGGFSNDQLQFMPSIQPVLGMYLRMLLAMGLVFEMPTVVFFLARVGLVTAWTMLRYFKYAILVIFIVAAVLTPGPDAASQCLMAGPMIALYVVSIGIAWAFQKKKTA
jgi:sec-independent protein translocase protein TatC